MFGNITLRHPAQRGTLGEALLPHQTLLRQVAVVIVASVFLALSAQVAIKLPIGPVPISGITFGVLLVGGLLGPRLGLAAGTLYVAEGIVGLPVFGFGAHGWAVITGSTGGYILSYPFVAMLIGWLAARGWDRRPLRLAAAMFLGNVLIYAFGLPWLYAWGATHAALAGIDHMTVALTLKWGLIPFIPGDLAKLLLAAGLVPSGWQLLRALHLRDDATPETATSATAPLAPLAVVAGLALAISALLPWTVGHVGLEQPVGIVVFIAGLAGAIGGFLRLRGSVSAGIGQLSGFAAGAIGGLVAFVHLVQFTQAGGLSLADISYGPPVGVIAALVLLASAGWDATSD